MTMPMPQDLPSDDEHDEEDIPAWLALPLLALVIVGTAIDSIIEYFRKLGAQKRLQQNPSK